MSPCSELLEFVDAECAHVFLREDALWKVTDKAGCVFLEKAGAFLPNDLALPLLPVLVHLPGKDLPLPFVLPLARPLLEQPLDLPVVFRPLPVPLRLPQLVDPVILREFLQHLAAELELFFGLRLLLGRLELLLILVRLDHHQPRAHSPLELGARLLPFLLLHELHVIIRDELLHLLLLLPLRLDLLALLLQPLLLCRLLLLRGTDALLFAPRLLFHELQDLAVLLLEPLLLQLLEALPLLEVLCDIQVGPLLLLVLLHHLLPVFVLDLRDNRVHHLLFFEIFLVGSEPRNVSVLHLLFEHLLLLPEGVAARCVLLLLRLNRADTQGLHLLVHPRLV
eukprot:Hpha_TRINITY_DN15585_c1_g5::TRINITY_DN15585_c1_g5_i1::g.103872::m.103872